MSPVGLSGAISPIQPTRRAALTGRDGQVRLGDPLHPPDAAATGFAIAALIAEGRFGRVLYIGHSESPFVIGWEITEHGRIGGTIPAPATLPANDVSALAMVPLDYDNDVTEFLLMGMISAPWVEARSVNIDGTLEDKELDLSPTPGSRVYDIAVIHDDTSGGHTVLMASGSLVAHAYYYLSGWQGKYPNPGVAIPGSGRACAWEPNGGHAFHGSTATPFIFAHPFTHDGDVTGFGVKVANPASLPPDDVVGIAVRPQGDFVAAVHNDFPHVWTTAWSGSAWGAIVPNPSPPIGFTAFTFGGKIAWSPDGTFLLVGIHEWPGLIAIEFDAAAPAYGRQFYVGTSDFRGTVNDISISADGSMVAVASDRPPWATLMHAVREQ